MDENNELDLTTEESPVFSEEPETEIEETAASPDLDLALEEIQTAIGNVANTVSGLSDEISGVRESVSSQVDGLSAEIDGVKENIASSIGGLAAEIGEVKSDLADVKAQVSDLRSAAEEEPKEEHVFMATPLQNGGLQLRTVSPVLAALATEISENQESDEEYETIPVNDLEKEKEHNIVFIGRQGENLTQKVVFDCTHWAEILSNPTYSIVAKRHGETETYLATNVSAENNIVTWTLTDEDTAYSGFGEAEIRGVDGDMVKKSAKFRTWVEPSVEDYSGDTPVTPPYWGTEILTSVDAAEAAAQEAEEHAAHVDEQMALNMLHLSEIEGTTQEITFTGDVVSKIEHKSGETVVRTDTFTITDDEIVERRQLSTGETLIMTTTIATLKTTVVLS